MSNPSFKRRADLAQLKNAVTYRQSNMKLNSEVIIKIEKVAIHPCSVCPKAYTCLDDFNKHITKHDPSNIDLKDAHILKHIKSAYVYLDRSKSFQCEHCGDSFQHCRDYKLHKLIHIQQAANVLLKASKHNNNDSRFVKLYKCSECDSRFVARSTLIAHAEAHEPRSHVCHCGIGYFKKCDLNSHRKLVHPDYKEPEAKVQVKEIIKTKLGSYSSPKLKSKARSKKVKRKNGQIVKKAPTERRFGCPVCEKTLASKSGLIIHLRMHTGEKPYPCGLCGKRFAQVSTRTTHLKRHAGVKDFECEHCGKSFYSKGALDLHLRVHTKEKPYKCLYCEKAFSDPSALGRHHRIHTGLKPYQCPLCPNKYSDISALVTHKQRHVNYKAAECELCHKKFPSKHNLRNHLKVMHTNIKDYECSECGKTFALKSYLKAHIRISHMPRQYRCSHCEEDLSSKASLATHCGTVHNCAECKRGFPGNSHMVGHILYHPGAWFECDECGTDYKAKTQLHQHIAKKHSNIRCNVCSWRVMSKSELVKHKERGCLRCQYCNRGYTKSHACRWKHSKPSKTKKRPKVGLKFVCDSCGQDYSSKQLLVSHIRLVHTVTLFCSECPEKFYSDELFQRHKLKGCKRIECEICGEVVFSQRNYERHLEVHSGFKYKCHKCDRSFGKEDVLKKHLIVRHGLN